VIQVVSQTARNGTYLRDKTLAHWIAMNVITEQRLQSNPPEVTETSGEVEYAGQDWKWTMKVTQTEVKSLRRMDVTVRRADAPEKSTLTSLSGFYGTAITPTVAAVDWSGASTSGTGTDVSDEEREDSAEARNSKKNKKKNRGLNPDRVDDAPKVDPDDE
jgi:general secretion pathway protein I